MLRFGGKCCDLRLGLGAFILLLGILFFAPRCVFAIGKREATWYQSEVQAGRVRFVFDNEVESCEENKVFREIERFFLVFQAFELRTKKDGEEEDLQKPGQK